MSSSSGWSQRIPPITTNVLGKTQPRLFTPPLSENINPLTGELRPERTHGYAAISFAREMLHMKLFPWQEWLLIHALELVDDGFGCDVYRFRVVIVECARQNGKTVVETVLALWHLYALESREVIGSAQDLPKAEDAWRDAVALAEGDDELADLIEPGSPFLGHPKTFRLVTGCEYRVTSTTGEAGRGFSGDFILMDELRSHKDWGGWSAVNNTMNARPDAQTWAFSNAGSVTSVVLRYQRALAHRDLGWPDGEREFEGVLDDIDAELAEMIAEASDLKPGWFEWSAPPGAKRNDLDALAQANPSMNHYEVTRGCPTTRTLLSALASCPAYEYETEVMCRWATMGVGGPFPEGSWEATCNEKATPTDDSIHVVCVEVSAKRSHTFIARSGLKADGTAVVGITYDRPGTDWVHDELVKLKDSTDGIVIRTDTGSPSLTFYDDWQDDPDLSGLLIEWKGSDVGTAYGDMFDRLRDNVIEHLPHQGLDMAATSAVEALKPGGGWTIDIRRSPSDVAPLYAATGAVWGLSMAQSYNVLESVW